MAETVAARLRSVGQAVWRFISDAPLTYSWLLALTITTVYQHLHTGQQLHSMLLHRYTNLQQLATDPLGVLFSSLFWIDGRNLEAYLLLFTLFLAPAEHWLGQLRWLAVGLSSHIVATYVSEGLLYWAIENHGVADHYIRARDIGVSYFLVGVTAVLAYHIARPWRWGYLAVLFVIFGFPLITMDHIGLDFTVIGHFAAIIVGLAFYPMARERKRPALNPANLKSVFRRSRSREQSPDEPAPGMKS